ncbi:carboxymuconolactone decarboxylase family protein [Mucilaginibacter endophyticus]|uniref:carboxymuconolactone decarboxylase family protein n=1 Tax=Mucilaginibacter endophyticus TaxID=2675003 RepID=UPI000E0CD39B|nr:carboxymuconolactone decarboxylase family protein [Mucilaginibacter endophyticus]
MLLPLCQPSPALLKSPLNNQNINRPVCLTADRLYTSDTTNFNISTKAEVSPADLQTFDHLEKALGIVSNLYAYFAKNDTALSDYLALQNRKNMLIGKEGEVINLVVSQVNECEYCLAAHTVVARFNGFKPEEILAIM